MKLKQYLFNLPESKNDYSIAINLYWKEHCDFCKRSIMMQNNEYHLAFHGIREMQREMEENFENHWIFNSFVDKNAIVVSDETRTISVTIVYEDIADAFYCEECKNLKKTNKKTASHI
ncbi:MAG: hypothetical protein K2G88_08830 [Oscillospiraceae bacterium]|nr:hypothetical protein [Oscillospiraceae bacterium]